jgi:hypothetical protein
VFISNTYLNVINPSKDEQIKIISMKQLIYALISIVFLGTQLYAQDNNTYDQFDNDHNVLKGVYLGFNVGAGEIDGKTTFLIGGKASFVANRKFEVGVAFQNFYSQQNFSGLAQRNDVYGGYGGAFFEPIFSGSSSWSFSIPLLLAGGAVVYTNDDYFDIEDWQPIFVFEPGLSVKHNFSRYIQLEMGVKYRFSNNFDLIQGGITNINGFSGFAGLNIGVFNVGRQQNKAREKSEELKREE